MPQQEKMKQPVNWIHTTIQSILFIMALAGMFWNFSTSQQRTKDEIESLRYRMDIVEKARHDDAILQRADMSELRDKLTEILILLQNKQDRKK